MPMAIPNERPLLQSAIAAVERNDLDRAEQLFRKHFSQARDDAVGLADYGNFCLRTDRYEPATYLLQKAARIAGADADVLTQMGFAQSESGHREDAQRSFEAALKLEPAHPMASYGLAQCHLLAERWREAIPLLESTLATQASNLPVLLNLAEACCKAGDFTAAAAHYDRARRLAPNDATAMLEHGKFLRARGQFERAIALFDAVANQHPDEPVLLLEQARCRLAMGDRSGAMALLERLDRRSPDLPECHEEFGNCHVASGDAQQRDLHWGIAADLWIRARQFALAEPLLDKLLAANSGYATAWNLKGMLHEAQQRYEEAEAAFGQAIALDPEWLDAAANLSNLLEQTNKVPQARAIAETALEPDSQAKRQQTQASVTLLFVLARVARRQKDYPRALALLDRMETFPLNERQRRFGLFERGKLCDLMDDADSAIAAFTQANAIAAEMWQKSNPPDKFIRWVEYALDQARQGWHRNWPAIECVVPQREPAFLVGFPRSGTTLLNQILDGHPGLQALEEKTMVSDMLEAVRAMPEGYPHAVPVFDRHDIAWLREVYAATVAKNCPPDPARLLVDKLPLNLVKSALIHRVFPIGKFILAIRHPCDAVLSCFMQDFETNDAMASFFALKDTVALYARAMDLWNVYAKDLRLDVHRIRYEDLVDDLEGQTRALCDFLGIEWIAGMQDFSTRARERGRISTPSYSQVSQPIYREARYRWERYRKHLEPFLPALRPYILQFGYDDPLATA